MKLLAGWSDLLIERGTRDPLGLWRVGDRMINELLGPFTTVVTNRPARYLSMYCWIFLRLENNSKLTTKQAYWKDFYRLEAFLICAIALHNQHDYLGFGGQIGVDTASQLIEKSHEGFIDLGKFQGIANGWNTNYKLPMLQFGLIESDISGVSGILLTKSGRSLGKAYHSSLSETTFFKKYSSESKIPRHVLEELSDKACTCRLHHSESPILKHEKQLCIQLLKSEDDSDMQTSTNDNFLKDSIALILNAIQVHHSMLLSFNLYSWRKFLSTEIIGFIQYPEIIETYKQIFRHWQFYNVDSLLTYCLEQGLNGILEYMHSSGGSCKEQDFNKEAFCSDFSSVIDQLRMDISQLFAGTTTCTIEKISKLSPHMRFEIESSLNNAIENSSGKKRVVYCYLFFLYVTSVYQILKESSDSEEAHKFYFERSHFDGAEISLDNILDNLIKTNESLLNSMASLFVKNLIINRQLKTRGARKKEQAWISYTPETKTYEWENGYSHGIYRAARIDIFMNYLYSLDLVESLKQGWSPTVDLTSILGIA